MLTKNRLFAISFITALLLFLIPGVALAAIHKCQPEEPIASCVEGNPIFDKIELIVNLLSAGVVLVVVGTIIFGGIQYIVAGENPTQVTAAKQRIINGLIAFVAFLFVFAFLQWIIPGGIFNP